MEEPDFVRKLRQILMEPEIETVQEQLQALIEEPRALGYTPISLDTTSVECLESTDSRRWPRPRFGACPFHEECELMFPSTGKLRTHLAKRHKIDTTKTRDEIHVLVQNLIERDVTGIMVKEDGERITTEWNHGVKAPIKCHFCDFIAVRDSIMEAHWKKQHSKQLADMQCVGIFWAKMRHFLKRHNRFPTLLEMLGEHEALRCQLCGDLRQSPENMMQHLKSQHKVEDPSRFDVTNNTYIIEEMQREDVMQERREEIHEEEAPQEEELPQPVERTYIEIPDEAYRELEELGISNSLLRRALQNNDIEVFKMMLKLAMQAPEQLAAAFLEMVRYEKAESNHRRITTSSDIGDLLWNLTGQEWPQIIKGQWCALCNEYFADKDTYLQHRLTHGTNIPDLAAVRDFLRLHIPETALYATTTSEIVKLQRSIVRCEVPGCGYCFHNPEEYRRHLETMITNPEHVKYIRDTDRMGTFYGALHFLTTKNNRLPTIGELLGNVSKPITICSTCFQILPKGTDALRKHYEQQLHRKKRGAWSFAANLAEKTVDPNEDVRTQFDILIHADKQTLDQLIA